MILLPPMFYLLFSALLQVALVRAVDDYDVLQYINPLIGSTDGGIYFRIALNLLAFLTSSKEMSFLGQQSLMAWPRPLLIRTPKVTKADLL